MKVSRPPFNPVTITLETQDEVDFFHALLSYVPIESLANDYADSEVFEIRDGLPKSSGRDAIFNRIWEKLS